MPTDPLSPPVAPTEIRLLKFGGLACPPCVAMAKSKMLERFAERHPGLKIKLVDVQDEHGDHPYGSAFHDNFEISNEYGVTNLPTLVFEARLPGTNRGVEMGRIEGGVSLRDLEKTWDNLMAQFEASEDIPWDP